MNCKKCGAGLVEDDKFCKNCGAAVEAQSTEASGSVVQPAVENAAAGSVPAGGTIATPVSGTAVASAPTAAAMPAQKSASNGNFKLIIGGIIAAIVVVVAVLVTVLIMSGKEDTANKGSASGAGASTESGTSEVAKKSTHTVYYGGFAMEVPNDMETFEQADYLEFGDESGEWMVALQIASDSFSRWKANQHTILATLQSRGYEVLNSGVKTIGGVEFLTYEVSASGSEAIAAYGAADSSHVLSLVALNAYGEIDYDLIETMAPIVKSMKAKAYSNNITTETWPKMEGLLEQ